MKEELKMPDKKQEDSQEFPDYSQATADQMFNCLMAMRPGQPEDALRKAENEVPRKKEQDETEEN